MSDTKTQQRAQQQAPSTAQAGQQAPAIVERALPEPVARRGISEAQWRTMVNNLFPGADVHSVLMVWDYCVARKLDPLKKPCHIVPMSVKDAKTGEYEWRDVVMPGIYEYRTTAMRTQLYLGHTEPMYGEIKTHKGVDAPEWCSMVMRRWNEKAGREVEFPVKVFFRECAGSKKNGALNERWVTAPIQMLTKVCEAAGLREAFPDELGGEHTADEMEGQTVYDERVVATQTPQGQTRAEQARSAMAATAQKPAAKVQERQPEKQAESRPDPQHGEISPASQPSPSIDVDSVVKLKSAKTKKELRAVWDAVLDRYIDAGQEVPHEVEDAFQMALESLPN